MKFILVDNNPDVCIAFNFALRNVLPNFECRQGYFETLPKDQYDIVFTPGNSYGQMTGGFDLAVRNVWPASEAAVQGAIRHKHAGMLPVGDCVMVGLWLDAPALNQKWLIYPPTMRVPMPIVGTENAYWAYRAAFRAVKSITESGFASKDSRVILSAFGTSAGHMNPMNAAMLCKLAWEHTTRPAVSASTEQMFADHKEIIQWV